MKKIMIDLDDTITVDTYLNVTNRYLHTNYTYNDINKYWVDDIVPKEQMQDYLDFFYNKINIYDFSQINPNAIKVIEKLTKYYDVCICSAYIDYRTVEDSANILPYKHKWLLKNLPFLTPDNFIFTNRKDLIKADIKIDDRLDNLEGDAELKILITAYHNQNISKDELNKQNVIRVNNWNDIAELLLKD